MRRSLLVLLGLVMGTLVVLTPAADAWDTEQEATSACSNEQGLIDVTFRNTEQRDHSRLVMYVIAIDEQSGVRLDLGAAVPFGGEANGVIETGLAELGAGRVRLEVTWALSPGVEIRYADYEATGPCTAGTTEICHVLVDPPALVPVPTSLLQHHLDHGDYLPINGACVGVDPNGETVLCQVQNNAFVLIVVPTVDVQSYLDAGAEYPVDGACREVVIHDICHINDDGRTATLITITEFELAEHLAHDDYDPDPNGTCRPPRPQVELCHVGPDGSVVLIVIDDLDEAEHLGHGDFPPDAQRNCEEVFAVCHVDAETLEVTPTFVPSSEFLDHLMHGDYLPDTVTGCEGNVELCHRGDDGSVTLITVHTVLAPLHLAHGDRPVNQNGNCGLLAELCHVDNGEATKIEVPVGELATHFGHGDYLPLTTGECVDPNQRAAICHTEDQGVTFELIYIGDSDIGVHVSHGDFIPTAGPPFNCSVAPNPALQQKIVDPGQRAPGGPVVTGSNDPIEVTVTATFSALADLVIDGARDIDRVDAFQPLGGRNDSAEAEQAKPPLDFDPLGSADPGDIDSAADATTDDDTNDEAADEPLGGSAHVLASVSGDGWPFTARIGASVKAALDPLRVLLGLR